MAKLFNLARMSTATTGTGTITLDSAISGFLSFAGSGVSDGDVVTYAISDGSASEIGRGTYTASGTTLSRDTILASTNSGSAISLSGSAQVIITAAAEDLAINPPTITVYSSGSGTHTTATDCVYMIVECFGAGGGGGGGAGSSTGGGTGSTGGNTTFGATSCRADGGVGGTGGGGGGNLGNGGAGGAGGGVGSAVGDVKIAGSPGVSSAQSGATFAGTAQCGGSISGGAGAGGGFSTAGGSGASGAGGGGGGPQPSAGIAGGAGGGSGGYSLARIASPASSYAYAIGAGGAGGTAGTGGAVGAGGAGGDGLIVVKEYT